LWGWRCAILLVPGGGEDWAAGAGLDEYCGEQACRWWGEGVAGGLAGPVAEFDELVDDVAVGEGAAAVFAAGDCDVDRAGVEPG